MVATQGATPVALGDMLTCEGQCSTPLRLLPGEHQRYTEVTTRGAPEVGKLILVIINKS